jgi:hypothetical protein
MAYNCSEDKETVHLLISKLKSKQLVTRVVYDETAKHP